MPWALKALGAALIACAATATLGYIRGHAAGSEAVLARWNADRIVQAEAHIAALDHARSEERRRVGQLQETVKRANDQATAARADARRAAAASDRLREHARELAARCSAARDPGATDRSPPAAAAGDLLAELLERVDAAAGELARHADQARIAGAACERAYDSLTTN
jgi:septal ring factor EnvC (AmiA/AmiB activator)